MAPLYDYARLIQEPQEQSEKSGAVEVARYLTQLASEEKLQELYRAVDHVTGHGELYVFSTCVQLSRMIAREIHICLPQRTISPIGYTITEIVESLMDKIDLARYSNYPELSSLHLLCFIASEDSKIAKRRFESADHGILLTTMAKLAAEMMKPIGVK